MTDELEQLRAEVKSLRSLAAVRAPVTDDLAMKLRKALAEGENWQVRGLASSAADLIDALRRDHRNVGKLADETADRLSSAERERDEARADYKDSLMQRSEMDKVVERAHERMYAAESQLALALVERDRAREAGRKILAKLDHPTASVTQWDADELRDAIKSPAPIPAQTQKDCSQETLDDCYGQGVPVGGRLRSIPAQETE